MEIFARFILMFVGNTTAVLLAGYFMPEFQITASVQGLLPMIITLTIVNLILRPIIKIILSPLIFLTFGFFTVIINAGLLFFIDIYTKSLTISGLLTLIYATLIISFTNIIIHHAALFLYRRPELN